MTVIDALKFRNDVGGEAAIMKYNHDLAIEGSQFLATQWNTSVLQEEDQVGNMVDVRLPLMNPNDEELTSDFWIDTLLYEYSHIYSSVYKHGGQWYARFSVQIYNDMDDFKEADRVFAEICDSINAKNSSSK